MGVELDLIQSKCINQVSSTSISTTMNPKYDIENINTNLSLLGHTRHDIPLETKTIEKGIYLLSIMGRVRTRSILLEIKPRT